MKPTFLLFLTAAAFAQDPAPLTLWNGNFNDGTATPTHWKKEGAGVVARDTEVFKTGPAALRVESTGKCDAVQVVEAKGARKFKIAGFFKTAGGAKAQVVVMPTDEKFTKNQWHQAIYGQGDGDWRAFEKEVTLPDWTARVRVQLHVEGEGSAWMDELSIDGATPLAAKPGVAAAEAAEAARPRDPAKDEPSDGKPWEPGWCIHGWRSAWVGMHKKFLESAKQGEGDVILMGDSITMGWKDRWGKTLAPLKVVNLGIGGDSTRQLLWRVQHGELDGRKPKLVVLAIGTNNLYGDKNKGTDAEIAQGIEACLKAVREKLPAAKVLLVAILPRQNEYFSTRIKKINAQTVKLADGKDVHWLDLHDVLMKSEPGTMKDELFVEKGGSALHPNDAGYDALTAAMKPVIEALLK